MTLTLPGETPVPLPQRVPRPFTQSELWVYKRCRRRWWLGQYRGLRKRREAILGAAPLGNRIHDALALYYDPASGIDTPADVLAAFDEKTIEMLYVAGEEGADEGATDYTLKDIEKEAELGRLMLEGYFEWLAETGADGDWEILGAERVVEAEVANYDGPREVRLFGKLDLKVLQKSNRARRFVDHKSVANLTDLPKKADIDEQFQHYSLLELLDHLSQGDDPMAEFVDGGTFNMLRKVKRTARANPPFYGRHEVRFTLDRLRHYWDRVIGTMLEIQRTEDRLAAGESHHAVAYPTPGQDCDWACEFRSVCPMLDEPAEDAEGFLAVAYEVGDPLARYAERPAGA